MHLPDGIIPIEQSAVYWCITLIVIAVFLHKFSKNPQKERTMVSIALFSVFFVVVTSLSIPSPLGVPIHFFLIPLVAIILGPFNGSIVSFFGLLMQALALDMGGIVCFGANFLVIGVVVAFVTYGFYTLLDNVNDKLAIFISTVAGIVLATFAQILILMVSGAMNLDSLLATLVPFYLFVGVIEGFANTIIIYAIRTIKPEIMNINKI
ncbi:energy-coupling factor ABC transporter permease [uncultured Methanobrevibacter sp.]|uniref:energy-coupling factor ABC transporter permease n=1 Tax=uncultured Methanobrevibacter sp. TaxID=253161 RepID=UPI002612EA55|nr:energy-coupling factor ABC transporter permease [uncultured Methanobrevibacter sp.]